MLRRRTRRTFAEIKEQWMQSSIQKVNSLTAKSVAQPKSTSKKVKIEESPEITIKTEKDDIEPEDLSPFEVYPCGKCFKEFESLQALNEHANTHIRCDHCDQIFRTLRQLTKHISSAHRPELNLPLKHSKRAKTKRQSLSSIKLENDENSEVSVKMEVEVSPLLLQPQNDYFKQFDTLHNVAECEECNDVFPTRRLLRKHIIDAHKSTLKLPIGRPKLPVGRPKLPVGRPKLQVERPKLQVKQPKKSGIKLALPPAKYICNECGKTYKHSQSLKEHFTRNHTVEYNFNCADCGKKFKLRTDLITHLRTEHTEGQEVGCEKCGGRVFQNKMKLKLHYKRVHRERRFACDMCTRKLMTKKMLEQHRDEIHFKKRLLVCEICGKTFYRQNGLKKHMRVHSGAKPYTCKICSKSFGRSNAMKQHLLTHTGLRPYICDVCNESFTQKSGLILHRKSHPGPLAPLPVVHIDALIEKWMSKNAKQSNKK